MSPSGKPGGGNYRCELTTNAAKRRQADEMAASVKKTLPSGLAQPALRALVASGLTNLDRLSQVKEEDVAKLHGMGPKAMATLREALKKDGKSFLK